MQPPSLSRKEQISFEAHSNLYTWKGLQCVPCVRFPVDEKPFFPAEDTVNFMAGLRGSHTVVRGKHVGSQAMNLPR